PHQWVKSERKSLRITPNVVGLTEISLFHAIDFGQFNVFVFERRGCLLIMRGECFAMSAPGGIFECVVGDGWNKTVIYQGAKNSTRMSASGLTTESKLTWVRLMTSDGPSARATAAKASTEKSEVRRMLVRGRG